MILPTASMKIKKKYESNENEYDQLYNISKPNWNQMLETFFTVYHKSSSAI